MNLAVRLAHDFPGFALDVEFSAPPGVTALFGRSGAGKTSVVNAVAGLLRPHAGRVEVGGRLLLDTGAGHDLPVHKRRIGYVFQEGRLFPHLDVRGNLEYGPRVTGRGLDRAAFAHVVELLALESLLARRPATLSGGEKSRVAIGRALLSMPRMLLLDEPLAALDAARKAEILPYLERLRDETDIPILYVSHAVTEIARLATTVIAMEAGRVVRAGPAAELLADPEAVHVFGLGEAGATLTGRILRHHADGLTELDISGKRLLLPRQEGVPGTTLRVRIAARDVILALRPPQNISALNILPVTVTALRRGEGPGVMVQLRLGRELLLARITRRSADALGLREGIACHAVVKTVSVAKSDVGGAV